MRFLVLVRPNADEVARYEAGGMRAAASITWARSRGSSIEIRPSLQEEIFEGIV